MSASDLMHRAQALRESGRFEAALAVYREIIAKDPEDGFAQLGRADVLRRTGRPEDALAAYQVAIAAFSRKEQRSENVIAEIGRAEALREMGRLEDALAAYDDAIAEGAITKHPAEAVARVGRAEVFHLRGQLSEALGNYSEIISRYPNNVDAKLGRADILREMGRVEEAQYAYKEVIAEHPNNLGAGLAYARLLHETNRLEGAEGAYRKLIDSHPEAIEPKLRLANVLRETGSLDEAETVYRKLIAANPESNEAKLGLAELLRGLGRLGEADVVSKETVAGQERPPLPTTDPLESEFRFSENAKQVLVRSRTLAEETRRAGVTSSCLLFGFAELGNSEIDTARFVRHALNRSKRYEDALDKFRKDYGKAAWAPDSGTGALLGHVSRNVRAIFEQAATIALRTSDQSREIHARHLFAALIVAPDRGDRPVAVRRLDGLGIELPALRQEFREFIHDHAPTDNPAEWDAILTPSAPAVPEQTEQQAAPSPHELERDIEKAPPWRELQRREIDLLVKSAKEYRPGTCVGEALRLAFEERAAIVVNGGSGEIDPLHFFLCFLEMGFRPTDERRRSLSLPLAITKGLNITQRALTQMRGEWVDRPSGSVQTQFGITERLKELFTSAVAIRERCTRNEWLAARHVLAAFLLGANKTDEMPFDREALTSILQNHLLIHKKQDNSAAWKKTLTQIRARGDVAESTKQETSRSDATAAYQSTYSAFIPDRAIYGSRSLDEPLADELNVGQHAGHLAQLIAAKDTWMPLSIGLFGAWGSGKSYFIDLLDQHLRKFTNKTPGDVFHKHIVQIRFNAWHYLDTNLWANLVCEIFDQLFATLGGKDSDATAEQVKKLKSELTRQSALAAQANEALEKAGAVRIEAEEKLRLAMQARAEEEKKVGVLLDDLKKLAINDDVRRQLAAAAEGLGLPKLESSFAELETRVAEMRSLGGRAQALALAVFTGPGWWRRALLLAVAIAVPLGVAGLAKYGPLPIQDLLTGAGKTIAQVVAAITAFSAWISAQAKAGNSLVQKVETAYDEVKKVRDARERTDEAAKAQQALAARRQEEQQARHTLNEAEEKMKTIQAELAELAPGRQLIRFLKGRASAEDYKRHLGLVSLVRKDFEQLSELLTTAGRDKDPSLPQIDRIVLYIDDLDRCRADRVIEVLEAVHLLLAFPLFAVVVAVDPRWLRQSLLDHYPRLLGGADDTEAKVRVRQLGQPATPQDYLEKIFQVPFNLQTMDKPGFEALVTELFSTKTEPTKDVGATGSDPAAPAAKPTPIPSVPEPEPTEPAAPLPFAPADTAPPPPPSPSPPPPPPPPPPPKPPPPPDPQRLALTKKEITDAQRFQPLFQTPRAVKRLANTYCLIRVGVEEKNWAGYLGPGETPGTYRVAMLLLAVTSSFPALAHPWLHWLMESPPLRWQLAKNEVAALTKKHGDTTDGADWERLARCLGQLNLDDWHEPTPDQLAIWVPRVARYSF